MRRTFPRYTGMLVVTEVLPGFPSYKVLAPGDILLRVNGHYVTQFEPLEEVLDDSVGKPVQVDVERGGKLLSTTLTVGDLHAITPSSYAEFGDAVVHTLSYQMARAFNTPPRGVFIANPGYVFGAAGIQRGAVIIALNGRKIEELKDFEAGIAELTDDEYATVRYITMDDPNSSQLRPIRMDRLWFPAHHCDRDDNTGYWNCRDLAPGPPPKPATVSSTTFPHYADPRLNALAPSLAMVTFDMPYSVSGVTERYYHGTGLVVDAERGLVVVDRNTVPAAVGDVTVTFAGTVQVPGRVVYVHPLHNYAVVAYDPRLIGTTPVKSAKLEPLELAAGEHLWVVGLGTDSQMHSRDTEIASIEPLELPLSRTMHFRDSNLETVQRSPRRSSTTGCSLTRPDAYSAPGRALPTRTAGSSRRTPAACPSTSSPTCSSGCAPGARCIRSRPSSTSSRSPARVSSVCRRAGPGASRRIPRRAARCSPSCVWWEAHPRRSCCSREICCSRSTARW